MYGSLAALVGITIAAPVPKPAPAYYHPTAVGDAGTYQDPNGTRLWTYAVTAAERTAEGVVVSFEYRRDGSLAPDFRHKVLVSEHGVSQVGINGAALDPPMVTLKLPAKPGDDFEQTPGGLVYKVGSAEEITVPAGKFKAVPLTSDRPFGKDRTRRETVWWAPRVGIVRIDLREGDARRAVSELAEFTPAKK